LFKLTLKNLFKKKTLQHYELLNRLCPELSFSSKGELKTKNLPHLNHVVLVKNKLTTDDRAKYPGTWSFDDDIAKFNGRLSATPKLDFDDTVALLFTVKEKMNKFFKLKRF